MIGIYWKYKDYEKSEKYWGLTSIQYKYLNHIFLDFEFKFNQSICEQTNEFSILKEQKTYLLNETKTELEKLLVYFDKKQTGVNSITKKTQRNFL